MDEIRRFKPFLSTAFSVDFYGGSAEPLLNKELKDIIIYLKSEYGLRLMVNTNGSMMEPEFSEVLIAYGFDHVLLSYHAASKDKYRFLTSSGNIDRVNQNLKYLCDKRNSLAQSKPVVELNVAVQKENSDQLKDILRNAKTFGVDAVVINRYYGGRNGFQEKDVSYDKDCEKGNALLDEIYRFAKEIKVRLKPEKPAYWVSSKTVVAWNESGYQKNKRCYAPWINLFFEPVLDEMNSFHISVCNRIVLFRMDYKKTDLTSDDVFRKLWNHPLLQYLRQSVNSAQSNPICRYCKNCLREKLRNQDIPKYAEIRDTAVAKFFNDFRTQYRFEPIEGLAVLDDNPSSDARYVIKRKGSF